MIDTIVVDIPFNHSIPIYGGATLSENQEGMVVWRKEKHRRLEGSFDQSTMVKTVFDTEAQQREWDRWSYETAGTCCYPFPLTLRTLRIEGSAAKFLQGHNLFGSDNVAVLVPIWCEAVLSVLGLSVPKETMDLWRQGHYRLHRVDVARMGYVESEQAVADVLAALTHQATYRGRGRAHKGDNGCWWGSRGSRQTVVKAYGKFVEINRRGHELPEDIEHREGLKQFAHACVRFEVEFHARALDQLGLRTGASWHSDTAEKIYEDAMSKLRITGQMPVTQAKYDTLPLHLQGTYDKWLNGRDVRATFKTREVFYRHRRALLDQLGVDIALPHSADHRPKVVSLSKVIQPIPRPVPSWAYGTSLLAAA